MHTALPITLSFQILRLLQIHALEFIRSKYQICFCLIAAQLGSSKLLHPRSSLSCIYSVISSTNSLHNIWAQDRSLQSSSGADETRYCKVAHCRVWTTTQAKYLPHCDTKSPLRQEKQKKTTDHSACTLNFTSSSSLAASCKTKETNDGSER